MTPTNPSEPFTPFLPTTYNIPEDDDRLKTFLVDKFSNFADVINDKKIGIYSQTSENLNGDKWFYISPQVTRNGYQTIIYLPSLPNNTTKTINQNSVPIFPIPGIDPNFVITQIWGSASKPCSKKGAGDGVYFSFMNQGDARISFTMSDTTIVITTTVDLSGYSGFIVISYLRDGT